MRHKLSVSNTLRYFDLTLVYLIKGLRPIGPSIMEIYQTCLVNLSQSVTSESLPEKMESSHLSFCPLYVLLCLFFPLERDHLPSSAEAANIPPKEVTLYYEGSLILMLPESTQVIALADLVLSPLSFLISMNASEGLRFRRTFRAE